MIPTPFYRAHHRFHNNGSSKGDNTMSRKIKCPTCNGRGTVIRGASFLRVGKQVRCPNCGGTGEVPKQK